MGDTDQAENDSLSAQCMIRSSSWDYPSVNLLLRHTYQIQIAPLKTYSTFSELCAGPSANRQQAVNDGAFSPDSF